MDEFKIETVSWHNESDLLKKIRYQVFCCEWRIPLAVEFDEFDNNATHLLVRDNSDMPVATGRLLPSGEIGRIAVVIPARGKGIAKAVLNQLLDNARKQQIGTVYVNSALEGVEAFKRQGFTPINPVFMEAGIPRQRMMCKLDLLTELTQSELQH
jgi:predicted GNAT family N-acyltransferase